VIERIQEMVERSCSTCSLFFCSRQPVSSSCTGRSDGSSLVKDSQAKSTDTDRSASLVHAQPQQECKLDPLASFVSTDTSTPKCDRLSTDEACRSIVQLLLGHLVLGSYTLWSSCAGSSLGRDSCRGLGSFGSRNGRGHLCV
jgi:hypothetical protein